MIINNKTSNYDTLFAIFSLSLLLGLNMRKGKFWKNDKWKGIREDSNIKLCER